MSTDFHVRYFFLYLSISCLIICNILLFQLRTSVCASRLCYAFTFQVNWPLCLLFSPYILPLVQTHPELCILTESWIRVLQVSNDTVCPRLSSPVALLTPIIRSFEILIQKLYKYFTNSGAQAAGPTAWKKLKAICQRAIDLHSSKCVCMWTFNTQYEFMIKSPYPIKEGGPDPVKGLLSSESDRGGSASSAFWYFDSLPSLIHSDLQEEEVIISRSFIFNFIGWKCFWLMWKTSVICQTRLSSWESIKAGVWTAEQHP